MPLVVLFRWTLSTVFVGFGQISTKIGLHPINPMPGIQPTCPLMNIDMAENQQSIGKPPLDAQAKDGPIRRGGSPSELLITIPEMPEGSS